MPATGMPRGGRLVELPAMAKRSAGLILHRSRDGRVEVLLVHPGGPMWQNKDEGAWTIPKGEPGEGEELLAVALREFAEETGADAPAGPFAPLTPVRQKSGKVVHAWACAGDFDCATLRSNTCTIEWPPRSGKRMEIPEVDRAEWFGPDVARRKINPAQVALIDELERALRA
jgi:predicted NUDIX family NTP pyrophosphohydrolase